MIKLLLLTLVLALSACSQKQSSVVINNHRINVEVADTESKKTQGLSNRSNLCPDCGMLFLFDKPGKYGFWMKDMKFPLDFIYFKGTKISDLKENISPSTFPEIILPENSFDKVIEVNAGVISKDSLSIGQTILLDLQGN